MTHISQIQKADKKVTEPLNELVRQVQLSLSWYWLFLAIIATTASVICATFQVLSYFCR